MQHQQNYFSQQQIPKNLTKNWIGNSAKADQVKNQFSFNSPDENLNVNSSVDNPNFVNQPRIISSPSRSDTLQSIQHLQQTDRQLDIGNDFNQQQIHHYNTQQPNPIISLQERLKFLDNYRIICEKRIRDLAPQHPLPVLPSHCGLPNQDMEELKMKFRQQMLQMQENGTQFMDTYKLKSLNEQLLQEKSNLENALRQETLANEEQRNYIQILRNAIDQKMESLGLGELIAHHKLQNGQDPISIYTIISEIKREAEAWKKEAKNLDERLAAQEEGFKKEIIAADQIKSELSNHIDEKKQLIDQLTNLEQLNQEQSSKIEQLEAEKNQLLDYVEENVKQIDKINSDLDEQKINLDNMFRENNSLKDKVEGLIKLNEQISSESNELKEANDAIKSLNEQFKEQNRSLKKENQAMKNLRDEHEVQLADQSSQLTYQQNMLSEKSLIIETLKSKIRELEEENMNISKERDQIQDEKNIREKKAKIDEESLLKRIAMHEEYGKTQDTKIKELEDQYLKEIDELQKQSEVRLNEHNHEKQEYRERIAALEKHISELKKQRELLFNENTNFQNEITSFKNQLEMKHGEWLLTNDLLEKSKDEVESLQNQYDEAIEKWQVELQRREWLAQEREKLLKEGQDLKAKLENQQVQNDLLLTKATSLEKDLNEQRQSLHREIQVKQDETLLLLRKNDTLSSEHHKYTQQLDYLQSVNKDLEQRIDQLLQEIDQQKRERKIADKVILDLRAENEQLFKNEERVRKYIEENDQVKALNRQKDRDILLQSEKIAKLSVELETVERENKRVQKDLTDLKFDLESSERIRSDLSMKHKEAEKRWYEMHTEKTELQAKLKVLQNENDELTKQHDKMRVSLENDEQDKAEMKQQISKLRQQQTDFTIISDKWNNQFDDLTQVVRTLNDKARQFLSSFLQRLNTSDQIMNLVSRSTKEQCYLLLSSLDVTNFGPNADLTIHLTSLNDFKQFVNLIVDFQDTLLSDYLMAKQDLRIAETKVVQLESRLGSVHTSDILEKEKCKFLTNEIEALRQQKIKLAQEINEIKDHELQKDALSSELISKLQALEKENRNLHQQIIESGNSKHDEVLKLKEQIKDYQKQLIAQTIKDQRLHMLTREKSQLEELISKIHQYFGTVQHQRMIGDMMRTLQEKQKNEQLKLKFETQIQDYEHELAEIVKSQNSNEEGILLRGHYIRREITSLQVKVKECEAKNDELTRKERQLESDLRIYSENQMIEKFAYTSNSNLGESQTITFLTKEAQELKQQLVAKTQKVNELEAELNHMKSTARINVFDQDQTQDTSNLLGQVKSQTNILNNTFERQGLMSIDRQHHAPLRSGSYSRQTIERNFDTAVRQPVNTIKIEDYDYRPVNEKIDAPINISNINQRPQTSYPMSLGGTQRIPNVLSAQTLVKNENYKHNSNITTQQLTRVDSARQIGAHCNMMQYFSPQATTTNLHIISKPSSCIKTENQVYPSKENFNPQYVIPSEVDRRTHAIMDDHQINASGQRKRLQSKDFTPLQARLSQKCAKKHD